MNLSHERVLSCLANWSPLFAECDYFPSFVFPFVTLFKGSWDTFTCFELVVSVITNWCQHWFEYFPSAPLHVLTLIEDLLKYHDKPLYEHFLKLKVTGQVSFCVMNELVLCVASSSNLLCQSFL